MIAALHIFGTLVSLLIVNTLLFLLGAWIDQRNAARGLQDVTVDLGRPLTDFDSPERRPELVRYLGAKYSNDLLKNRLSDFFAVLLTAFSWFVLVVQLVIVASIAWFSYSEDQGNAVFAWLVLLVPVLGFTISLCVIVLCKLLTGRTPGEAKHVRKTMAETINRASQPVT